MSTCMWFPQPWFCIYIYTCICDIRFRCFPIQHAFILPKYIHVCTYMYTNVIDSEVWTSWYDYQVCGNYCWKPQNTSKNINILPDFTKRTFTTYLLKWIEVTLFNRFTLLSLRFYRSTSILQYSNSTLLQNTEIIFPT